MTWGKQSKKLAKAGVKKAPPPLRETLRRFLESFWILCASRQYHAAGYQPLLRSEIDSYLATEGRWIPRTLIPYFFRMMRALDSEYLDITSTK